ncbi:MAG: ABC transporter ATP-binding protein/permease [Gemmatimonadota bacterium]|nr:ABC transporter ATP-binding protein/permease [Gemmatimonadota bacterium]
MVSDIKQRKRAAASQVWQEAREIIWTRRRRLALGGVIMIFNRAAGLVIPGSSKFLIDNVIGQNRAELLFPLAAVVGGAALVQSGTSFALSQVLGVMAQRAITDMRKSVQAHVSRLPVSYFDSTKTGVLISRIMTDAEGIRNLVGTGLVQLTGGFVTAAIALTVLFVLNWELTLIILIVLGTFAVAMTTAFKRLRPLFRERGKINAEVTGRLGESLGGIRVVKAYVAERAEHLVFARGAHRLFRNIAKSITGIAMITSFTTLIIGAVAVIMIVVGGRAIMAETMTLGDFIMYLLFTGLVARPLIDISQIGTQISEAFAGLDRIREVRRMLTEQDEDASREPMERVDGEIVFEDVSFEYDADVPVLKGVSFRAAPSTTTALVGSSGSGKSTLISLVMAFNEPKSGKISVDGRDLATIRMGDYRRMLGVVLQENFLFDGTIAENIAFSRPHATLDEIREVAQVAHAYEFIEQFEHGYDTIVGERGVKLSGGQRQRIAIARAILADPRILILDEATSSLDSDSEAMIQDGLRTLRRGRTTFVIAHRLSTIRSADQILVLEGGEIIERGSHSQLLAKRGRYRHLYDKQYMLEHDRFINPGEDFTPEVERPVPEKADSADVPRDL